MARLKFDKQQVIQQSLDLFWQQSYIGCSMQQIFDATGLKPGSFYLAFGNKETLFREALLNYHHSSISSFTSTIESAPNIGEGLCRMLEQIVLASEDSQYCSCLLIKAQLELSSNKNDLYTFVTERLQETEHIFQQYIKQYCGAENSHTKAAGLMLQIFGIRVYGYQQGKTAYMLDALKSTLQWLPWKTRTISAKI